MKLRKMMSLVLGSAVTVSLLAACGGNTTSTAGSPDATAGGGDETPRHIVIATRGNGEPYSLVDEKGNWTGIEADLWAEVAERTGWTYEVKQLGDLAAVFGEIESGRADVAANCYAITEERLKSYLASDPIYADAQIIAVKEDSSYQTLEDLRGKTIGVTSGQAAQNTINDMAPEYDWKVVTYEDTSAGFQDCDLGRVDAYAHTVSQVLKFEEAQGLKLRMLDEKLFGNNVGWWFPQTEDGKALRDECNQVLAEMQADGTVSEIVSKWMYGEDMTQLISDEWLTANQ